MPIQIGKLEQTQDPKSDKVLTISGNQKKRMLKILAHSVEQNDNDSCHHLAWMKYRLEDLFGLSEPRRVKKQKQREDLAEENHALRKNKLVF